MQRKRAIRHFEFHVSRESRDNYQFDQSIYQLTGNVVFANFHAARVFAQRMNAKRDLVNYPEQAVKSGQINALGLIDEISHLMVEHYREEVNPNIIADALKALNEQFGAPAVDAVLDHFSDEFPPLKVYRRELGLEDWLSGETNGVSNRELALEEMMMLWLTNENPATTQFMELFDDDDLEKRTVYPDIFPVLHEFFGGQEGEDGAPKENLLDILRAPALAAPHSLTAQLDFIRQRWGMVLDKSLYKLLSSLDLIQEEEKAVFVGGGPGPVEVFEFEGMEADPERYTLDREWMPRLVLMAKNAYVWMDQLTRQYGREINRLDQVPDEELDKLARFGFTGLWLIGLWERSTASKTIKQMMGNPEAVASAYSLLDYRIAEDLGGEEAVNNLRQRAWQRGIRLASDMVPNHMGIDANWVMDHPDWFIQLPYSPFPSYSFNGPNLSPRPEIGIYLEDHYFDRTDAAVVFKRVDHSNGDTRYIYHGNDGTSMPWNDTAQLNYLMPEVREAVIQTILYVARQFPVIRFDAAMTLAKRHIQRLWFPEPGTGGAIASRAEFGMTKQQLDALMPEEFWREVVDRAAVEAPDTLLLAEAFWMLEGYFVRTLGMHRVYNSAFMNMIRDEENAKYRVLIKNTLEFDAEILKRYVNFMNNPDEKTAVEQFGKGDKYFGVCTLMITLPGLPMFGHGQIEGFAEKYGMEYRRAYWDEQPDQWLMDRHAREITPLLHKRYLFAGVENFLLYDFTGGDGAVNEDVFAYSNSVGDEKALVIIHNKYATARGWIKVSSPYSVKTGNGDERTLKTSTLSEGLQVSGGDNMFTIFRDQASGLEFIRSSKELAERGMYLELGEYKTHVFLDFREVADNEIGQYRSLTDYLNGQGVPSVDEALRETFLQPIHGPYRELVNADLYRRIITSVGVVAPVAEPEGETPAVEAEAEAPAATEAEAEEAVVAPSLLDEVEAKALKLAEEIKAYTQGKGDAAAVAKEMRDRLSLLLDLEGKKPGDEPEDVEVMNFVQPSLGDNQQAWAPVLTWLFTEPLGRLVMKGNYAEQSRSWVDEWLLRKVIVGTLKSLGADAAAATKGLLLTNALITQAGSLAAATTLPQPAYSVLTEWLKDEDVRNFLQVNRFQNTLWYNKEAFEQLVNLTMLTAALSQDSEERVATIQEQYKVAQALRAAQENSAYKVENLLAAARGDKPAVATS